MVVLSTKSWQWWHQLGQLCIPKPAMGQEILGSPGRGHTRVPGDRTDVALQVSDGYWPCQHYPTPPPPPPLCLPDTECGQEKAFYSAEFSLFVPSPVSQDITSSSVCTENHLESLVSCCQLHFATGVYFFHYSSFESLSFPAVNVVSKASLHCAHPCSPLLHISCPSAFPALPLPSPSNNKLKGSPWPALWAVQVTSSHLSVFVWDLLC